MLYIRRNRMRIEADVPIDNIDSGRAAMTAEGIEREFPTTLFSVSMLQFADRICAICLVE